MAEHPRVGQVYADNDRRSKGRILKVVEVGPSRSTLEVLTNANDIQRLLDDETPGTRSYLPRDKRGSRTTVSNNRLGRLAQRGYSLIEQPPNISGPTG